MAKRVYETITGRRVSLVSLSREEKRFLQTVRGKFRSRPGWSAFGTWWTGELGKAGLTEKSAAYRICQDLEARLGIAEGKVGAPDYRDYLADLIEEKYGSRYEFCKQCGVDTGHLSRVLASRSELSIESLRSVLGALGVVLVVQGEKALRDHASPAEASRALAGVK
jgi:transcriptional regulator with XRE-family HTH domain